MIEPRERERLKFKRAAAVVERHLGVPRTRIEARDRKSLASFGDRALIEARRTAVYLTVVAFDLPTKMAARAAQLSPNAVRKTLREIEERRENPAFDEMLETMELEILQ